jgi:hypothetical protein
MKKEKGDKDFMDAGKPPSGLEVPSIGASEGKKKKEKKFASHAPVVQLITIEEDMHETQTSHYSYQVKEGENSDRDPSRHHLSTSNNLRNSNVLNELDDSLRRQSVNSGDYSGGSQSSKKKAQDLLQKDIDSGDI